VAEFIGSPPMNFLRFEGVAEAGRGSVQVHGHEFLVPDLREGAKGPLALGVRPEHVRFSDSGMYRGKVIATEYLGTTQIVTIDTPNGEIKARTGSEVPVKAGENVGLELNGATLTVFDAKTGLALRSAGNERVLGHG
jgi:multiple sugar transport system ATP-binding protein